MISTRYDPKQTEDKWYQFWEENNLFHAEINPRKKPYCIVIPPPNITGILHMGHALNNTIQDILIDFMPNLHVPLLGVKSFLSNFILTIDYPDLSFSLQKK